MNPSPILKTVSWPNEEATAHFAQTLAHKLSHAGLDGCITLHGELGAGKTTFVRHLLRALGVSGRIKSPTYAVVEPYEVTLPDATGARQAAIWHFDFYRFSDPREWEDAGFRDLFASSGLKVCEWPERVEGLLPLVDLQMHLDATDEHQRVVKLVAHTSRAQEWVA